MEETNDTIETPEEGPVTQKKTLRLKTAPRKEETPGPSAAGPTVMATMNRRSGPVEASSNTSTAILALIATLLFAALLVIQAMEWQAYKFSFPRPQVQGVQ